METIRFALVEDEEDTLDDRVELLNELSEKLDIEIAFTARTKKDFFEQYKSQPEKVDALILDIELVGAQQGGLEIAMKVKKPVLFISGYTRNYINSIEEVENSCPIVKHLTKPVSDSRFELGITNFCKDIRLHKDKEYKIRLGDKVINVYDIVFIEQGEKGSKCKTFYFANEKPVETNNFTFERIKEWNIPSQIFRKMSKQIVVNENFNDHNFFRYIDKNGKMSDIEIVGSQLYGNNGELI